MNLYSVEKPEFIVNLSSSVQKDQILEMIDSLFQIIDKFDGFICPECRSIMSLTEKIEICETCGYDSKSIYP